MKEFPPFRLDTVNQCLWRSGSAGNDERVLLTPKAFAVLRHLVEHAGRLVSQDELLDAAWHKTHVEPAVLNNQILHLRQALGDHPRKPVFIETLSRRGYRFIAPVHDTANDVDRGGEPGSTKLIGRHAELRALRQSLAKVLNDIRQIVFVTGETGIGKTALLDAFRQWAGANAPHLLIVRGQCIEGYGGKEPYYPVFEALNQLCRGRDGDVTIRILASHAPTWLVQFPALMANEHLAAIQREILGATRERMLREIGDALEVVASTSPLALFFEDVHWVDPATVDLISALARRRAPAKLMILSTYRPADVESSNSPIKALTQDLLIHDLCLEIALEPLTETETTDLLAGTTPGTTATKALGSLLYRHAEGNPLFVVAALEHLNKRGLISKAEGAWQPSVPLPEIDLGVPENLRRMIEARIERLTGEEQRVLEAASLQSAGRHRFAVLTRAPLAEMDPEGFEKICDTLSRRQGILRQAAPINFPDGAVSACYKFVHELYREVCHRRISGIRRVRLHHRLGELVEARLAGNVDRSAGWLADHFEQGGDWLRAIGYLRIAADTARRRYAWAQTITILQRAENLLDRLSGESRETAALQILEQMAAAHGALWNGPTAIGLYQRLIALAGRSGLMDVEIRALLNMAVPASWTSTQLLIETVNRALGLGEKQENPTLRRRIQATCYAWRASAGRWRPEDAERCRDAVEQLAKDGNRSALAECRLHYAQIQSYSSRYSEARGNATDGLTILLGNDIFGQDFRVFHELRLGLRHSVIIRSLVLLGEWGEALKEIRALLALEEKNRAEDPVWRGIRMLQAWLYLTAMDFHRVLMIFELMPASFVLQTTNRYRDILWGSAQAGLGNHQIGLERLMKVRQDMQRDPMIYDWIHRVPLLSALTELWLAQGDRGRARREADDLLEAALATDERTYQGLAWEANARVAMAEKDWSRAEDCIAKALSIQQGWELPLAAWRVHGTAAALFARRGDDVLAGQHRERSRATIRKLADSLPPEEPLRQKFLAAPDVQRILSAFKDAPKRVRRSRAH